MDTHMEKVADIQKQLEEMGGGDRKEEVLKLLNTLQGMEMSLEILTKTRVGMNVNQLRKETKDPELISAAKSLLKKWKKYLVQETGSPSTSASSPLPSRKAKGKSAPDPTEEDVSATGSAKKAKLEPLSEKPNVKTQVSFSEVEATTDAVRLKCRELLLNAIRGDGNLPDGTNDPEWLSEQLEEHIWREFRNTETKYKNRIRSRVANLKDAKNPNLRLNFLVGEISPARLGKMSAEEMASDELKAARTKFMQESLNDAQLATNPGTKTDLLKCGKCHKRDCTYNQLQTRSADEPMTTFVLCNNCGHRWKFN